MEIKEPNVGLVLDSVPNPQSIERSSLPIASKTDENPESAAVSVEIHTPTNGVSKVREEINQAINVLNVATEATSSIGKLVDSVEGITQQLSQDPSPQREELLKTEASNIVNEIDRTVSQSTSGGIRPLAGDPIRIELEQELGRTLEILLPDSSGNALGFKGIGVSQKEFIINTQAAVATARQRLDELRKALDEGSKSIRELVSAHEVASQNSEASKTSIRDVDQALKITVETSRGISKNPEGAISSVGDIQTKALNLLDQ